MLADGGGDAPFFLLISIRCVGVGGGGPGWAVVKNRSNTIKRNAKEIFIFFSEDGECSARIGLFSVSAVKERDACNRVERRMSLIIGHVIAPDCGTKKKKRK